MLLHSSVCQDLCGWFQQARRTRRGVDVVCRASGGRQCSKSRIHKFTGAIVVLAIQSKQPHEPHIAMSNLLQKTVAYTLMGSWFRMWSRSLNRQQWPSEQWLLRRRCGGRSAAVQRVSSAGRGLWNRRARMRTYAGKLQRLS